MRIIINFISGILLLLGLTGLTGMAIVRIHAKINGIDAARRSGASETGDYISQAQASSFIIASYLGILGLFIAYWLIAYSSSKSFYKHPLFILGGMYVLFLLASFLGFYMVYQ